MTYIFKGNLRGFYCGDWFDYLHKARIRIYAIDTRAEIITPGVEHKQETFRQRSDNELRSLANRLLFETETDAAGNFTIHFTGNQKYDGGAFEIDFGCGNLPVKFRTKRPPGPKGPFQFHITTMRPNWRETSKENESVQVAYWEHGIADKSWCGVLELFNVYVICGRVVDCKGRIPIQGLKVKAFDVDLIQDDYLGESTTDGAGRFKIFYTNTDFTKTIIPGLNVERPAGPDIYFSIENGSGTLILLEPRSRGHQHDRENVSNCFCIELCVGIDIPVPPPVPVPAFLKIGAVDYQTQMHSELFGSGLTNNNYAFFGAIRLNGILAQTFGGLPMEYCFEFTKDFDGAGFPVKWQRVQASQLRSTSIGYVEKVILINLPAPHYIYNNKECYVSNVPIAGAITTPAAVDGWILVPQQMDNPTDATGNGMFVGNGNLVMLDTKTLMPFPPIDLTGMVAANDATSTGQALAKDAVFALRMLVRQQGNDATKIEAGICNRVAINNTLYTGMSHHPEWGAWGPVTEYGVCMLDVQQLIPGGCSKITDRVDVLYTVAHPNIGSINLSITGPLPSANLGPIAVSPNSFGTVTHNFLPTDPQCAYLLTLTANYLLTTGDANLPPVQDQIAFCR